MSYINKEQAIDLIESMIADKGVAFNPHKLAMALKDMESVEIVRCKDCIHCADDWNGNEPMFTCELARCCESVYPDDFCSYGEKQVTGKLESVEKATSEGEESTMGQPKSKLESDTISRQAAIDAVTKYFIDEYDKMPYEYDEEVKDNVFTDMKWVDISLEHNKEIRKVLKSLPPVEPKPVCEDAISKHDLWRIIEDNAYWVTYNETSKEKGMTLTGINQALNECPPVQPERPKGEWVEYISDENGARYGECTSCNKSTLNAVSYDLNGQRYIMNFCPNCGADMRGEKHD